MIAAVRNLDIVGNNNNLRDLRHAHIHLIPAPVCHTSEYVSGTTSAPGEDLRPSTRKSNLDGTLMSSRISNAAI
jgi:hypothetical protein